jgi:hypothetical protein
LTAAAEDDLGNVVTTSMPVNITVVPNNPPVVTITAPSNGANFFVGANVTNRITASDADGAITNVDIYLDGTLVLADALAPYVLELCDITAGPHTLSAVATDNGNSRSTNTVSIGVTNPPNITVLVPNGSTWRYLDDGSDQGRCGFSPFTMIQAGEKEQGNWAMATWPTAGRSGRCSGLVGMRRPSIPPPTFARRSRWKILPATPTSC